MTLWLIFGLGVVVGAAVMIAVYVVSELVDFVRSQR